jgi:hypothetical protein
MRRFVHRQGDQQDGEPDEDLAEVNRLQGSTE